MKQPEFEWISSAMTLLERERVQREGGYHAARQLESENPGAVVATLPLFFENADSPAMVKHAMMALVKINNF